MPIAIGNCKVTHCLYNRDGHCTRTAVTINDLGYCADYKGVDPEIKEKVQKLSKESITDVVVDERSCASCRWYHKYIDKPRPNQHACFKGGTFRSWITKALYDKPNDCPDWDGRQYK
jgi:hypothetical protein